MPHKIRHPIQPVVRDDKGVHRFKANNIVLFLLDAGPFDMNDLAAQSFLTEDREQFAQLIGYSVDGFADLSYASQRVIKEADRRSLKLSKQAVTI